MRGGVFGQLISALGVGGFVTAMLGFGLIVLGSVRMAMVPVQTLAFRARLKTCLFGVASLAVGILAMALCAWLTVASAANSLT